MRKLLIISLLFFSQSVFSLSGDDWFVSGYVGYSTFWSEKQGLPFKSQYEIGIAGGYDVTDRLRLFAQLKYYDGLDFEKMLVYGFAEYSNSFYNFDFSIRAGKVKRHLSLFNETRVTPRTRRGGLFQSQAVYWNRLEQNLTSGAGIDFEITDPSHTVTIGATVIERTFNQEELDFQTQFLVKNPKDTATFGSSYDIWASLKLTRSLTIKTTYSKNHIMKGFDDLQAYGLAVLYDPLHLPFSISVEGVMNDFFEQKDFDFESMAYGYNVDVEYYTTDHLTMRAGYTYYNIKGFPDNPLISANKHKTIDTVSDFGVGLTYEWNDIDLKLDYHYSMGGLFINPAEWHKSDDFSGFSYGGASVVWYF